VRGQRHAPAAFYHPGKTRYPLHRRLGGPQGRYGQVWKISPPPGFDPRTVQPVSSSRYTDWATGPLLYFKFVNYFILSNFIESSFRLRGGGAFCEVLQAPKKIVTWSSQKASRRKTAWQKKILNTSLCWRYVAKNTYGCVKHSYMRTWFWCFEEVGTKFLTTAVPHIKCPKRLLGHYSWAGRRQEKPSASTGNRPMIFRLARSVITLSLLVELRGI
jgi:hypothetical protein